MRCLQVEHFHRAIPRHLDVGGFEVAMHNPPLVRRFEGFRDPPREACASSEGHEEFGISRWR
jgi:hypothetical protein